MRKIEPNHDDYMEKKTERKGNDFGEIRISNLKKYFRYSP